LENGWDMKKSSDMHIEGAMIKIKIKNDPKAFKAHYSIVIPFTPL